LRARCSPPQLPRCPLRSRAACGSRHEPSTGRRRPGRGSSWPVAKWKARAEDEAASVHRLCLHLAAVQLDPLANTDEAVAEAVARGGADPVVAYLELER